MRIPSAAHGIHSFQAWGRAGRLLNHGRACQRCDFRDLTEILRKTGALENHLPDIVDSKFRTIT